MLFVKVRAPGSIHPTRCRPLSAKFARQKKIFQCGVCEMGRVAPALGEKCNVCHAVVVYANTMELIVSPRPVIEEAVAMEMVKELVR